MHKSALPFATLACLGLAACGSEAEGPTEQIVINEPGDAAGAEVPAAVGGSDLAAGERAFAANCAVCHSVEAGAASGVGPNLHGIVGRAAGALDDFAYSGAMSASGITWTTSEIEEYIANPTQKLPGTRMAGVLVTNPDDRAAISSYLAATTGE